ncbi:MAG TPA: DUF6785 family protein [Chthonomonadaceae bacterium]|nr:DUF6785 family protein [Chthonomonadaceae bacterium]
MPEQDDLIGLMGSGLEGKEERTAAAAASPLRRVRWGRVIAVTLPLIVLNCGWIANSEMKTGVTEVTISSLFMGVTFALFGLTLLNLLVRRFAGPQRAFNQAELMALYTMLSLSSIVAGVGHFGFFMPFLSNAFYYGASSHPEWKAFWPYLPASIGPRDPAVLKAFYSGNATFFQPSLMRAWAYPVLWWIAFFLVLLWTTLCLTAILRRRWADEEHLPFPVIALPLEMTREGAPLYRNRLLWLGFAIPCFFHSLNSLHSIYPTLPFWPINSLRDLVGDLNLQPPWNGVASMPYSVHPAGVGFGYLVNTDVSFSLWFFYLLRKAVLVMAVSWGMRDNAQGWGADANPQFPYFVGQGCGAWLALALAALWTGRVYFRAYFLRALKGDREGIDTNEAMSARTAICGFVLGFLALCGFAWSWGGSWWVPAAFLAIYLLIMVTLSRIRAEMAVVSSELVWINPQTILPAIAGTNSLSATDLTHVAALSWFNTDYRACGMPHELEGLVGMRRARGRLSPMVGAILLAAAVAMVSAALWDLQLYYVNGAATGHINDWRIYKGSEPWRNLQDWMQNPKPPDAHMMGGMAFGAGMTLLLSALRSRFAGFPLHPAAYAMNMSFANDFFWFDMIVAWLIKSLLLRYGGMKAYRQGLPFFLGLILGDFVTGSVWSIVGALFHLEMFRTFAT